MSVSIELISRNKMFGGTHCRYQHNSHVNNCAMTFAIYLPPQADQQAVPVLYWLSGLTCNDENFSHKAGAQKIAAELGIALVMPDTSPRGEGVADDSEGAYDCGLGAGFYLNATQQPWVKHYHMYDYVVRELPDIVQSHFNVNDRCSISGHSMGGHGALTIGLKHADRYQSISAFSPIGNPVQCPWGQKAFKTYLGDNQKDWFAYDAVHLLETFDGKPAPPILVDQGGDDNFLNEQLSGSALQAALQRYVGDSTYRLQQDYDHSYFFIATFIESHLKFHADHLF